MFRFDLSDAINIVLQTNQDISTTLLIDSAPSDETIPTLPISLPICVDNSLTSVLDNGRQTYGFKSLNFPTASGRARLCSGELSEFEIEFQSVENNISIERNTARAIALQGAITKDLVYLGLIFQSTVYCTSLSISISPAENFK